jgi:putative transposase
MLQKLYVRVFTGHGARRMRLGGVIINPTGAGTVPQARNLALILDQRSADLRFLIRDRGSSFTASVDAVFQATGARILVTAVQAPRMNAICEPLIGTLRCEVLDRTLIPAKRTCEPSSPNINTAPTPPGPSGHSATRPCRRR